MNRDVRWGWLAVCMRALVVAGLCLAAAAPAALAASAKVYWANYDANSISYANVDGTGAGGDLNTTGATVSRPFGTAVDPGLGKIFWSNQAGSISYARLDGSGGADLNTSGATVSNPSGVAVDEAAGKIYWANQGGAISYANLDGSGGGGDLNTSGATTQTPCGVAIDAQTNRIYWANANGATISYANLDGSGGGDLNTTGTGLTNACGVAIDPVNNEIYWADGIGNKISYAHLDGSGAGDLNTTGATVSLPYGVAVDAGSGKLYWGNYGANKVSYANLDGSGGGGDLSTMGASTSGVNFPSLSLRTTATSVSCAPSPVAVGASSTCTVTVSDTASGTASTPTGTVSFSSDGGGAFGSGGSCTLAGTGTSGVASCQVSYTPSSVGSGTHTITASYAGDSLHGFSQGTDALTVSKRSSSTSVSCLPSPVVVKASSRCSVTVSDTASGTASTPTGAVSFSSDGAGAFGSGGSCTLAGTGTSGVASCSVTYTPSAVGSGRHIITARYGADSRHAPSSGQASVVVVAASTAPRVSRSCSASAITSSSAQLAATVNPGGAPTTYHFEYGTSLSYGSRTAEQSAGSGLQGSSVTARVSRLIPATLYHCRLVATNADGRTDGADQTFQTAAQARVRARLQVGRLHARAAQRGCESELNRARTASGLICTRATLTLSGTIDPRADGQRLVIVWRAKVNGRPFSIRASARIARGRFTVTVSLPSEQTDASSDRRRDRAGDEWSYTVTYAGGGVVRPASAAGHFSLELDG